MIRHTCCKIFKDCLTIVGHYLLKRYFFSIKNEYTSFYIRLLNVFPKIGTNETGWLFLIFCFSSCLWIGTILAVPHSVGKIPGRKMKYRGLHSPLSQIWNMRMLIQSNPYALLGFNFLITVNPLDINPIKWSNTLKQFLHFFWRIVWLCLTILWGWRVTLIWVGLFRSSSWSGETGEGKITSTV